jgi:hypothetical protein
MLRNLQPSTAIDTSCDGKITQHYERASNIGVFSQTIVQAFRHLTRPSLAYETKSGEWSSDCLILIIQGECGIVCRVRTPALKKSEVVRKAPQVPCLGGVWKTPSSDKYLVPHYQVIFRLQELE